MRVSDVLRGTSTTFKVFIFLQVLFMGLATFEIIATINLTLYGPKQHIGEPSKILILIASAFSWMFPVVHWRMVCLLSRSKQRKSWKRSSHPASVVYLCLLCCIWIAADPTAIRKAFDRQSCSESSLSLRGPIDPSSCLLEKVKAVLAVVMAGLTFVLLQFVTCSNTLFPSSGENIREKELDMGQRLPVHRPRHSFRSFLDSQTLRPSNDTECMSTKLPPPSFTYGHPRPFRRDFLPPLNLPPLDFQKADPSHPAFKPELQNSCHNESQANLLPSPMHPLPLRPDRTTSMRSHPPTSQPQATATSASSIYSRSVSTESLFSRHPSPLSSTSDSSFMNFANNPPVLAKSLKRPPTPHQSDREPHSNNKPNRPDSKPMMPPAPFWSYARGLQQQENAKLDSGLSRPLSTHAVQTIRDPRTTSPLNFHVPFVYYDAAAEEHSSPSAEKPNQGSYERLRKGTRSPAWAGKRDLDRRLAAAIEDIKGEKQDVSREKSKRGKVARKCKPSTAF